MTIWQRKSERERLCETSGPDYEKKFVEAVADYIVDALRIPWNGKQTVKSLMITAIDRGVRSLLTQFLHSQLEIIGKSFNREFRLEAEIETGHAPHAKMSQFIEAIKAKYEGMSRIRDLPVEELNQLMSTWTAEEKEKLADLLDEIGERL